MAIDDTLAAFVRDALARGEPRERIRAALRAAGWDEAQVTRALDAWAVADFPIPVPRPRPYVSAAEAFQYLVLFSTLYAVTFNLGVLGFAFIDTWVPDPTASPWASAGRRGAVRSAIAAIVIAAPVFAFTARILARAVAADPTKRQSRVRKWLTYLTMFIAAGVVIGDAIALVNEFLAGELTIRFALRVLVVGGLAGSVFAWYLRDVRRDDAEAAAVRPARLAGLVATGAVVAAVVGGLVLLGPPSQARLERVDQRRVADLEELARSVDIQWTRSGALPADLAALFAAMPVSARVDPVTSAPYEYRVLSDSTYELCATFDAPSDAPGRGGPADFWTHGPGRQCFPSTVRRVGR